MENFDRPEREEEDDSSNIDPLVRRAGDVAKFPMKVDAPKESITKGFFRKLGIVSVLKAQFWEA